MGNGIAGTVAAQRVREAKPDADVIIFANEPYPLYNRIALPPFLKRKIKRRKVTIHDLEWHQDRCIDLRLNCTVTRIDPRNHKIETDEGTEYRYDKLLVATGGRPYPLSVPGMPTGAVFNFQTMDETLGLDARIEESKTAAVIGGSYIAYELAEAFNARGLKVSWIMRGPWFLRRLLEQEGGELVDRIADEHGVEIVHGDTIGGVESDNGTVSGNRDERWPAAAGRYPRRRVGREAEHGVSGRVGSRNAVGCSHGRISAHECTGHNCGGGRRRILRPGAGSSQYDGYLGQCHEPRQGSGGKHAGRKDRLRVSPDVLNHIVRFSDRSVWRNARV